MNTLQMILIGVIAVVILVALYAIFVYNHVVTVKVRVDNAFSDILVQLKRRADLIPNLIETVKGYTNHESATLEAVVKARSSVLTASTPAEVAGAEKEMKSALSHIFALAESYPELKANENFIRLQDQLEDTEDKIQASRRYYNGAVRQYNEFIVRFPANIFAGMFGYKSREFYNVSEEENAKIQEAPKVSF